MRKNHHSITQTIFGGILLSHLGKAVTEKRRRRSPLKSYTDLFQMNLLLQKQVKVICQSKQLINYIMKAPYPCYTPNHL